MTQTSAFWQGTSPGDAGAYSADTFNHVWEQLLHAGVANAGPIIDSNTAAMFGLHVQATGPASTNVDVLAGAAMVDGSFYESTATETIAIPANGLANPRIDTVVLQKDWVLQTIRLALLAGTPAASPVPPTLTQTPGVLWEIPLADITCASGFVTITNSVIRSRSEYANAAPLLIAHFVTNNSGGTLEDGDIVVWDSSLANAVKTTTVLNDPNIAGVWMGRTDNGGTGRVVTGGLYIINMTGVSVAIGNQIGSSGTAKVGYVSPNGNLGRIVQDLSDNKPRALIQISHPTEDYILIRDEKAATTNGGTFTSGAWRTRDLTTKVVDTGGFATLAANQITLLPGTYRVRWSAPAREVGLHKTRLYNITDGAVVSVGTAERSDIASTNITRSHGEARFTLAASKVLELQHQCGTTVATTGFGQSAGFSEVEVYSVIAFQREG
jgi:hypothetical protein